MSASTAEGRARTPAWVWALLVASLAINLFVLGTVVHAFWFGGGPGGRGPVGFMGQLAAYSKTLPEERRTVLWQGQSLDRPPASLRPLRDEIRQARQDVGKQLAAPAFDRAAFIAAEERLQGIESKLRQEIIQTTAGIAERMTAEERAGFKKWREDHMPWRRQAEREDGDKSAKKP